MVTNGPQKCGHSNRMALLMDGPYNLGRVIFHDWYKLSHIRYITITVIDCTSKLLFFNKHQNIYRYIQVIDQACSVKMAGYWPRSFFACLWTETKMRSINKQNKNEANIQPS